MVRFTKWGIIGLAAALVAVLPVFAGDVPADSQARIVQNLGALPMAFEANRGQSDSQVLFQARGQGYGLYLTAYEAVLSLMGDRGLRQPAVLRMRLAGSNPETGVSGLEALPGKVNYVIGKDRTKWRTDIATFGKVRYANVYPGIDLVYYGTGRQLEFDFILKPGARPEKILMDFKGAESLTVSPEGDLVIRVPGGELRQLKPVVYQETPEGKKLLDGTFVPAGVHKVGFRVSGYNKSKTLSIDPVLKYSSFLGGAGNEDQISSPTIGWHTGIAVDSSGNAYVVGSTASNPFPTTGGSWSPAFNGGTWDAFVTKVNAAGTAMIFSTYLGGAGDDFGTAVAIDGSNNVYVAGATNSGNFYTSPGAMQPNLAVGATQNGFITKLATSGSAVTYSTYLGGSGTDWIYGIKVDSAGRAYVTGSTTSANFPVVYPYQAALAGGVDTFVCRLNAACTYPPDFSTYLGGTLDDVAFGLALDASGDAYIVGYTNSADFPTVSPFQAALAGAPDAFVTKLSFDNSTHTLSLGYSTYLGGSGLEYGLAIAVDSAGCAYVTGDTESTNYPLASAFQGQLLGADDAFVTKLSANGTSLVYSTYLGGTGQSLGYGIAVDGSGNAYVAGLTSTADFPTCNPITGYTLGGFDAFYTKLNSAGTIMTESTRFGSTANDIALGIAVDASGNAYFTGVTSAPAGGAPNGFPNLGEFQAAPGGGPFDAFVTKLSPQTGCVFTCGTSVPTTGATGFPVAFTGTVTSTGCTGVTYTWTFGDATPNGTTASTTHIYAASGTYAWTFTATAVGGNTCTTSGSIVISTCALTCGAATVPANGATNVAIPFSTTAATPVGTCSGTITYTWNFGDGGTDTGLSTTHTYTTAGTYGWSMTAKVDSTATCIESGTITIAAGCSLTCSANVPAAAAVNTAVTFTGADTISNCVGVPIYAWDFGDGGTSSFQSATHTYTTPGPYTWTFTVTVGAATCTKKGNIDICDVTACTAAVTPTTGFAPLLVNFAGIYQPLCRRDITYDWNFGDGSAHSSAQQTSHTYAAAGTYTWTMTATVEGLPCTQTGTISVCGLTCTATVPATAKAGYYVAFTSTSSLTYCTGTPTYLWVFGDGGTSVIPAPYHVYNHAGTYYWTLTVSEAGGTCIESGSIVISHAPFVSFLKARNTPSFNIVVKGQNLQPGIAVTINGVPVPSLIWKSANKLVLEGGPALKALAPPNIPLQFHFMNPDGADLIVVWQYPL